MNDFFNSLKKTPAKTKVKSKKANMNKIAICNASGEKCFWINYGPIIKNIVELREALDKITDEQFDYHTKRNGNDFAKWLKDVLGEKELAEKVDPLKDRRSFRKALEQRLKKI